MKIATWNVERLKHKNYLYQIQLVCERVGADILVLTETDERLRPDYKHDFHTFCLAGVEAQCNYLPTERRVAIFTNYPCVRQYTTYDQYTALCVELETEMGNLLVYGTIMGIYGNRQQNFKDDLPKQCEDFARLSACDKCLCICGDYNLSFSDNYYFTQYGRETVLTAFAENNIRLLTADCPCCIDHIAIAEKFVGDSTVYIEEWNIDKSLSDHKGVAVTIIR